MPHFQKRLNLLKRRSFFLYVIGFLFAAIGNGLGYIATSWIVVSHGGGVTAVAILMTCFWGPNVILGPFMGVLADRMSRKWMMVISDFIRAILYITFSIYLLHDFSVNVIYVMMLCVGITFSLFFSCAYAFMRELVSEKELIYANSTVDIIYESGSLIGMAVAGFLIAWTSAETAILINGIAFLIATLTMICIPKKALCYGEKSSEKKQLEIIKDFREGLTYLWQQKKLMSIYTIQLLIFITYLTTPLLLVPFSKTILHATAEQFGIIEASASIGIVIGGIFIPWLNEQMSLMRTMLFFSCVLLIVFAYFGYNRSIPIAAGLYFIIGFAGAIWPLIISKAQALTDIEFQGRVQSTFNSLSGAMIMLFYFTIGYVGNYLGIEHLYFIEVGITALAIVFLIQSRANL